ncbi:hypothetical protein [Actinoplanes sp. N902-109]|uniref:hypothetical protein n=1 Tax=Actinoplanes sp. (strain N902-109) TaxID=649831 RepID=UPI00032938DB|nr:hypothetical protein [Actinoplanes sp. N902-109]AGL17614.1 hypothetical protein L083_4104 [Actinoplanes sp. N902-109]
MSIHDTADHQQARRAGVTHRVSFEQSLSGEVHERVRQIVPFPPGPRRGAAQVRRCARPAYAENDSYGIPPAARLHPGFDAGLLPGTGHINEAAGYGPWPEALAWCLTPATRLTQG